MSITNITRHDKGVYICKVQRSFNENHTNKPAYQPLAQKIVNVDFWFDSLHYEWSEFWLHVSLCHANCPFVLHIRILFCSTDHLHRKWYGRSVDVAELNEHRGQYRGRLNIPKGHYSEWFLFRKVVFRRSVFFFFFFFISKGHYSKDFKPKGYYIPNFGIKTLRGKIFGLMTLQVKTFRNNNLSEKNSELQPFGISTCTRHQISNTTSVSIFVMFPNMNSALRIPLIILNSVILCVICTTLVAVAHVAVVIRAKKTKLLKVKPMRTRPKCTPIEGVQMFKQGPNRKSFLRVQGHFSWFFSRREMLFHFSRPKANFSHFERWKKKKVLVLSSFWNFSLLPLSIFTFPFTIFLLSFSIPPFPFFLASFFPIGQQKFPDQQSLGGHSAPPALPPPVTPLYTLMRLGHLTTEKEGNQTDYDA